MENKVRALVAREIARALKDTGRIDPRFLTATAALLSETLSLEIADGGEVIVGDTGQSLEAAIGAWVASSAATPFLAPTGHGNGRTPAPPASLRKSAMTNAQKGTYLAAHGYPGLRKTAP